MGRVGLAIPSRLRSLLVTLIGFRSSNHPQQVAKKGAERDVDDRATVAEVFDPLHERFGFTVDVAAASHNAKCERFYDVDSDGLAQEWGGERVWCNPPYSNIRPWVEKTWRSVTAPEPAEVVVMLLPANRTEQGWWQDLVEPFRDVDPSFTCEFLAGRLRFLARGQKRIRPDERPPFGCCLLIWQGTPPLAPETQGVML